MEKKLGDLERKQENEHNLFMEVTTVLQNGLDGGHPSMFLSFPPLFILNKRKDMVQLFLFSFIFVFGFSSSLLLSEKLRVCLTTIFKKVLKKHFFL